MAMTTQNFVFLDAKLCSLVHNTASFGETVSLHLLIPWRRRHLVPPDRRYWQDTGSHLKLWTVVWRNQKFNDKVRSLHDRWSAWNEPDGGFLPSAPHALRDRQVIGERTRPATFDAHTRPVSHTKRQSTNEVASNWTGGQFATAPKIERPSRQLAIMHCEEILRQN
jgi:hypothetical protein